MTYIISAILVMSGFMAGAQLAYSKLYDWRIAEGDGSRLKDRYRNASMNGTIAVALYLVAIVMFGELLIDLDAASTWYKPILVLLLYDFGYYWLHRLLHVRKVMQKVHWVHHMNLHPTAVDSLYLHPVEMIAGLAFLLISIVIVGPLGIGAFLAVVLLHTIINILHHTNLQLPYRLAWLANHWASSHDAHHSQGGNYGVITPVWDWIFGTRS
ncbi:MAG: sterol desaturase family protein [Candidatus Dadabacteria bacterium]|nr:sterol desaturase family protein [Candidatus Dadabacteria bacterium]MYC40338.1 sterol desaturase family protein [Candidatus Dadabacteria bacterium]